MIVTCPLALGAHRQRRRPNQWMKPIQHNGTIGDRLGECVQTFDVRQFVMQYSTAPHRRPFRPVCRQNYLWTQGPGRQRNFRIRALQQSHSSPNSQRACDVACLRAPRFVVERLSSSNQPRQPQSAHQQPQADNERAY